MQSNDGPFSVARVFGVRRINDLGDGGHLEGKGDAVAGMWLAIINEQRLCGANLSEIAR